MGGDLIPGEEVIHPAEMKGNSECDTRGLLHVSVEKSLSGMWTFPKWDRKWGEGGNIHEMRLSPVVVLGIAWKLNWQGLSSVACSYRALLVKSASKVRFLACGMRFFVLWSLPKSFYPSLPLPGGNASSGIDFTVQRARGQTYARRQMESAADARTDLLTDKEPLP